MMVEIIKRPREDGVKELLQVADLLLLGNSWKEIEMRYARTMKKSYDEKGFKVNMKKTKAFCMNKKTVTMETYKFSCSIRRNRTRN